MNLKDTGRKKGNSWTRFHKAFTFTESFIMYQYESPALALNDLKKRGYTEDFNLKENCILCNNQPLKPEDFEIKEVYRFEGNSDPGDEAIVLGIESSSGVKGVLVNGYGYSSEPFGEAIERKLEMHAHSNKNANKQEK